jgi:hypothetical protein
MEPKDFDPYENLKIDEKNNAVYVLVNYSLFDKTVLISSAYGIQKFADVVIDSDGNEFAIVKLSKAGFDGTLKDLGREFNNRLVNYANYFESLKYTKDIKRRVIQEVYSQLPKDDQSDDDFSEESSGSDSDFDSDDMSYDQLDTENGESSEDNKLDEALDDDLEDFDVDEIVLPWEEKFKDELKDKNDTYLEKSPVDTVDKIDKVDKVNRVGKVKK